MGGRNEKAAETFCAGVFSSRVCCFCCRRYGWAWFFWKLAAYSVWLNAAFTLLSLLIVLHILYHDDVSGFKIGWIILILQLPVMGGLLYLLFGGKLPAHRMRRRLAAQHAETAAALGQDEAVFGALRGDDARAAARSRYITATGGYPVCMDSDVKYYPLGEEMYADMLRALESAEHFIFLGILYHTARQNVGRHCGDPQAQGGPGRGRAPHMRRYGQPVPAAPGLCPRNGAQRRQDADVQPLYTGAFSGDEQPRPPQDHGRGRHTVFTGGVNLSDEYINAVELHGHLEGYGRACDGRSRVEF